MAAVLAAVLLPTGTQGSTWDEAATAEPSPTPHPSPVSAPAGGDLVIVESGHTLFKDISGSPRLSWGAVITNTARELLALGTATLEGTVDGEPMTMNDPIPLLPPGATAVVGITLPPPDGKLADMRVVISEVRWWTATATAPPGSIVATDVDATVDDDGLAVRFRVESQYGDMVFTPRYHALFRNEDGDILGGDRDVISNDRLPPGWSIREIACFYSPPPGTARDTIEVFVAPQYG